MAYIIIPRRSLTQPLGNLELNGNHPLAQHLSFCAVPSGNILVDLISGAVSHQQISTFNSVQAVLPGTEQDGVHNLTSCIYTSGTGRGAFSVKASGAYNTTKWERSMEYGGINNLTILAIIGNTYKGIAYYGGWTGYFRGFVGIDWGYAYVGSAGGSVVQTDYTIYGNSAYELGNPYLEKLHTIGITANRLAARISMVYANNKLKNLTGVNTASWTDAINANDKTASNIVISVGAYYALHAVWHNTAVISADELMDLKVYPWQLFKTSTNRLYFDMPAAAVPSTTRKPLTLNAEGGLVNPTLLGSGTPAGNTFLRGDGTWQTL